MMLLTRRNVLRSLFAAPAIIAAERLMPVRALALIAPPALALPPLAGWMPLHSLKVEVYTSDVGELVVRYLEEERNSSNFIDVDGSRYYFKPDDAALKIAAPA